MEVKLYKSSIYEFSSYGLKCNFETNFCYDELLSVRVSDILV